MKKNLILRLLAIFVIGLAACGERDTSSRPEKVISEMHAQLITPAEYAALKNPIPVSSEAVLAGEQIFRVNCASCHGESGKGDGAASRALNPKPPDLSEVAAAVEDTYLFWRISEGGEVLKSAMPAWKTILSEEQRWQGVAYIRSLTE